MIKPSAEYVVRPRVLRHGLSRPLNMYVIFSTEMLAEDLTADMNTRNQGFPAEHFPKHHTASAGVPSSHNATWSHPHTHLVILSYSTHFT